MKLSGVGLEDRPGDQPDRWESYINFSEATEEIIPASWSLRHLGQPDLAVSCPQARHFQTCRIDRDSTIRATPEQSTPNPPPLMAPNTVARSRAFKGVALLAFFNTAAMKRQMPTDSKMMPVSFRVPVNLASLMDRMRAPHIGHGIVAMGKAV